MFQNIPTVVYQCDGQCNKTVTQFVLCISSYDSENCVDRLHKMFVVLVGEVVQGQVY